MNNTLEITFIQGERWQLAAYALYEINFEAWCTLNYRGKLLDQWDILKTREIASMKSIQKIVVRQIWQIAIQLGCYTLDINP